ncbi:hypothetical protein A33M_0547 [Rhodovulum sp. PH10]|uniref:DUF378 domain-containing protein n=1 Tax=Rhodovulum sp. PH10 TaxID=1187851 RepID=UPI00027C2481|nr:DUF378 domain-containing protein [Rhodovulum sp. PH10]EJW13055.1 hypothetical protein A33M_0547 [Rhodovulum sp. PH10]
MKAINLITLILIIVGGINWGLVGLFEFNLVDAIFGADFARVIYVIVGLSALWQLVPFATAFKVDEPVAQSGYRPGVGRGAE